MQNADPVKARPAFRRARKVLAALEAGLWKARSSLKARAMWRQAPDNEFTRTGFEVVPNFFSREECERLVKLSDSLLKPQAYRIQGDCYTTVRSEKNDGVDLNVSQIMNIETIDAGLKRLVDERVFQKLFEDRVGEAVEVKGVSIQIDGVDTVSKRGYHLDGTFPPNFKAFVYLTDVTIMGDGPYTVIPGSHRDVWKKAANDVVNTLRGWPSSDMRYFYRDANSRSFLAPAGTMILSTQDLAHKGWHDQHHKARYNLIVFLNLKRFFDGKPIELGKHRLKDAATP